MRVATSIELTSEQREQLQTAARSRSLPVRVVERAQIILLAAEGLRNDQIAARLWMSRYKVSRWRGRYAGLGFAGIETDAPRPGRTPEVAPGISHRADPARGSDGETWISGWRRGAGRAGI